MKKPQHCKSKRTKMYVKSSIRYQVGFSTLDWTLVTAVLVVALFVPVDGHQSAASLFLEAVRTAYSQISFALSLP